MHVYRISHNLHRGHLVASGYPARWNPKDVYVIYTAGSRSLAYLEILVHMGKRFSDQLIISTIRIPEHIKIIELNHKDLPKVWNIKAPEGYAMCQAIGQHWVHSGESAVLKVPSVIIVEEYNYLINPAHPDAKDIEIIRTDDFEIDPRILHRFK